MIDWCECRICGGEDGTGMCSCSYAILEPVPIDLSDWRATGVTQGDFIQARIFLDSLRSTDSNVESAAYEAIVYAVHI